MIISSFNNYQFLGDELTIWQRNFEVNSFSALQ